MLSSCAAPDKERERERERELGYLIPLRDQVYEEESEETGELGKPYGNSKL